MSKFSDLYFKPHPDSIPFTLDQLDEKALYCLLSPCKTKLLLIEQEAPLADFPEVKIKGFEVLYVSVKKWNNEMEQVLELGDHVSTPKGQIGDFYPGWEIARFDSAIREILPVKKYVPAITISTECD